MNEQLTETILSRRTVFTGRIFTVEERQNRLPDGSVHGRDIVLHNGAAGVLPIDKNNMVTLVRQFRSATQEVTLEIPAGKLDSPDEAMLLCAKRELSEEAGYTADTWRELMIMSSSPAILSEKVGLYMATGLHKCKQQLDDGEFLNLVRMPLEEAHNMALSGKMTDAKTVIAILMAWELLQK